MKTDLKIDSDNLFARRLQEKEAQRQALFAPENADSEDVRSYIYQQSVLNRKRFIISKPSFRPKF